MEVHKNMRATCSRLVQLEVNFVMLAKEMEYSRAYQSFVSFSLVLNSVFRH